MENTKKCIFHLHSTNPVEDPPYPTWQCWCQCWRSCWCAAICRGWQSRRSGGTYSHLFRNHIKQIIFKKKYMYCGCRVCTVYLFLNAMEYKYIFCIIYSDVPASSFMKTVGFSTIMSQCPLSIGWESSCVYVCSSAYLKNAKYIQKSKSM